nr:hypothetical protein [uncultured Carboxylicivirga sp.]
MRLTHSNNAFLQQKTVITVGNTLFLPLNKVLSIGYTVKNIKTELKPLDDMFFSYTINRILTAIVVFAIVQWT